MILFHSQTVVDLITLDSLSRDPHKRERGIKITKEVLERAQLITLLCKGEDQSSIHRTYVKTSNPGTGYSGEVETEDPRGVASKPTRLFDALQASKSPFLKHSKGEASKE